jgi:hypothetical protein
VGLPQEENISICVDAARDPPSLLLTEKPTLNMPSVLHFRQPME